MRAKREKVEESGDEEQIVSFRLGNETFGVKVSDVREIGKVQNITKIPKMPEYIEGVMNLRGQVTTVIDLKKRLNIDRSTVLTDQSRIIIAEVSDNQLGIIVDSVEDVIRIPRSSISPPPRTLMATQDSSALVGICKVKERMIMLMDIGKTMELNQTMKEVSV